MPTKQKGKKQSKGTVKSGDGFVSIDYEHSRAKLASGFTTPKDLGRVNKNAVPQVLGLHMPLGRASDCRGGKNAGRSIISPRRFGAAYVLRGES